MLCLRRNCEPGSVKLQYRCMFRRPGETWRAMTRTTLADGVWPMRKPGLPDYRASPAVLAHGRTQEAPMAQCGDSGFTQKVAGGAEHTMTLQSNMQSGCQNHIQVTEMDSG